MSRRPAVVLVVEDEVLVRMSTADALQDAGYHVVEARDGVEAIAVMEVRSDLSALLTDIAMPNMDGIALAKIVSERWPEIGIVITSGAVPRDITFELPPGARFLQKTLLPERLVKEIEAVLPKVSGPVTIRSIPTMQPGQMHGAGGLAQPLPEPEE